MLKKQLVVWMLAGILMLTLACAAPGGGQPEDPGLQQTVAVMQFQSTQKAQEMQSTLTAMSVGPTAAPQVVVVTATPEPTLPPQPTDPPTVAPTAAPSETLAATDTPQPVQQPTVGGDSQATEQAGPMYAEMQSLVKQNFLRAADGDYFGQENLDKSWFDSKDFGFFNLKLPARTFKNYVIRADVHWQVLGALEKKERTGCGFVYGYQDQNNQHVSFLGADSTVHTLRFRGVEKIEMQGGHYTGGLGQLGGDAKLMLLVDRQIMHFFVNDVQVVTFKDPYLLTGKLGLAVFSGSMQGIRCTMTKVGVWELK